MSEARRKKTVRVPVPDTHWPTRERARESRLFSPIRIGPIEARTRTWVPAMVPWRAGEDGFVTREVLDWYGRFADGKPGVLVAEATGVRDVASGPLLRIGHDRFLPGLRELVEVVRERSEGQTRFFVQIIDFLTVRRRPPREKYLERFLELRPRHRAGLAKVLGEDTGDWADDRVRAALAALADEQLEPILSLRELDDLRMGYRERVTDTHLPHIAELPRILPGIFADAAERARAAGFDGVELHFAHAYTMASFLSCTNDRRDGYGNSPEGRVRLPLEVIAAVRERVGDDYCLGCRFLGDEVIEGGSRVQDAAFYGEAFARAGLDFLSVSKGGKFDDAAQPKVGEAVYPYTGKSGHECMPTVRIDEHGPFGRNLPLSHAVRERLRGAGFRIPVVGAGGINSFELAEQALVRGDCDIIGAARQTLADPDWFLKMELGRGDEIRRCLYTNYCEALDQRHQQVTCQLWDREFEVPDPGHTDVHRSSDGKRRLEPPPWTP